MTADATDLAVKRTNLALERTRLALDRTLMAWVRTAASLISFGFTIYKAFQYLQDQQGGNVIHRFLSPRRFGMILIALGIGALALATLQHRSELRELYRDTGRTPPRSVAGIVSAFISFLGIFAFVLVFLRE